MLHCFIPKKERALQRKKASVPAIRTKMKLSALWQMVDRCALLYQITPNPLVLRESHHNMTLFYAFTIITGGCVRKKRRTWKHLETRIAENTIKYWRSSVHQLLFLTAFTSALIGYSRFYFLQVQWGHEQTSAKSWSASWRGLHSLQDHKETRGCLGCIQKLIK